MNSSDCIDRDASGRADTRVIGDRRGEREEALSLVRALIIVAHNRRESGFRARRALQTCPVTTQLPLSARNKVIQLR